LNYLGGNRRRFQSQAGANFFFQLRAEVSQGSNGARKLAHAHVLSGPLKALDVALHLGVPVGHLESERNRLGVNPVSAADHGRVLELPGPALEDFRKPVEVGGDDRRRLADEQRLRRVDYVVGG
jgi:hypothetical protein